MEKRVYNFSAGPAVLPLPVLEKAQRELVCYPGAGMSVMEMSHRSDAFIEIMARTQRDLRQILGVPDNYKVLFLQGGGRLQFSMVAMNLLRGTGKAADYILTGSWGKDALKDAQREGETRVAWDGKEGNYNRVPSKAELKLDPNAAYVHYTINETIQGVQFPREPETGDVPLVCDASSEFLSRPVPVAKYGLIYACAQKNAGPAGVTIVIVREDLLARSAENLPGMLSYKVHADADSAFNTPPCFALYMVGLVVEWLRDTIGGLDKMHQLNQKKAARLYEVIDQSNGFYTGHAQPDCRSLMNVTFRLKNAELDKPFNKEAEAAGLVTLKGHRSVGGFRASIYNAMPAEGVEALRQFMLDFARKHG